ncbi:TetR/AcrR family transcriptional regulator [Devosia sp.]|uniref:TetR/AcrR family transcriptional regulator n=1 Tax=Devosia sp. TaxID=1871048 RepID=UPI001B24E344|nr:TetR/AcrR family transcriptional regulator [Devosia sp.]MBO9591028.1 TetR/AcrR family transcriptional regulator [Devosia sp.]
MVGKSRKETMAETRQKLLAAGRKAFGTIGYSASSMDDFTADAGLTRGALYHHFGDKEGLLRAVVEEIDGEMSERLLAISTKAPSRWQGLVDEWIAYIEMALEPEIQRIMFRDAPAVLGDPSQWPSANACIMALKTNLDAAKTEGQLIDVDTEVAARLINGASSHAATWIASADDPQATSKRAVAGFRLLLESLRKPDHGGTA